MVRWVLWYYMWIVRRQCYLAGLSVSFSLPGTMLVAARLSRLTFINIKNQAQCSSAVWLFAIYWLSPLSKALKVMVWWFRNKYLHKYYEYYTFNHSLQMLTTLTSRKTTTKVFEYWRKTSNLQNIYWWMYFAHRSIASSSEEYGREKSSKKWVTLNISQLQNLLQK